MFTLKNNDVCLEQETETSAKVSVQEDCFCFHSSFFFSAKTDHVDQTVGIEDMKHGQ